MKQNLLYQPALGMRESLTGLGALLFLLFLFPVVLEAASHTTANFVVTASSDEIARRVANCAEYWRRELAIQWFEQPLPNWYRPCPISVTVGTMGASGQTTFTFENGEVHGWKMHVQGTLERVLDSVVPHEVNHTIFASYFRRPLPRWADEGAATLFEHESEQARQTELLNEVFQTPRRIPLKNLLTIREYPSDMRDVLTLYAEGYSLAGFLVGIKGNLGRKTYLQFLEDAHHKSWEHAISKHYGFQSIDELEQTWSRWVIAGSPPLQPEGVQLAANSTVEKSSAPETDAGLVVRSQSPQGEQVAALESAPLFASASPNESMETEATHVASNDSVNSVSGPLHSVPRRLRAAASSDSQSEDRNERERLPRPVDTLAPTTEGIRSRRDAAQYTFPEARR